MGNARKYAEGEVGDVVFGALGGAKIESYVGIAPEEKSGELYFRKTRGACAGGSIFFSRFPSALKKSAIPIQHGGQAAGAEGVFAVDGDDVVGETLWMASAAKHPADEPGVVAA